MLLIIPAQTDSIKIGELPETTSLNETSLFVVEITAGTRKITWNNILGMLIDSSLVLFNTDTIPGMSGTPSTNLSLRLWDDTTEVWRADMNYNIIKIDQILDTNGVKSKEEIDSIFAILDTLGGGGGQATIVDMNGTPTVLLSLETWASALSNWQDSFNANMHKIDSTAFYIDPRYFYVENDTLKFKAESLGTIGFGSDEDLILPYVSIPTDLPLGGIGIAGKQLIYHTKTIGIDLESTIDSIASKAYIRENFDNYYDDTDLLRAGWATFSGTDTVVTISVPVATANWYWQVTPEFISEVNPNDILQVKPISGGFRVHRRSGGYSGLRFYYTGYLSSLQYLAH